MLINVCVNPNGEPNQRPACSYEIEAQWIDPRGQVGENAQIDPLRPWVVFLHEGLGSVAMWRDFPQQFCTRLGVNGFVYSRPGYGLSTPRLYSENWPVDFLNQHSKFVLPVVLAQVLAQLPVAQRPISQPYLFGHSDGGSIALLFAAYYPQALTAAVVLAPHIMVESVSLLSIQAARVAYESADLKQRLARYHQDVDSAFYGWNNAWLSPQFESWNITAQLSAITKPILAIQGVQDEYGSLEQIRGIAKVVPNTQLLELVSCGHSAHKDQPEAVFLACKKFII